LRDRQEREETDDEQKQERLYRSPSWERAKDTQKEERGIHETEERAKEKDS